MQLVSQFTIETINSCDWHWPRWNTIGFFRIPDHFANLGPEFSHVVDDTVLDCPSDAADALNFATVIV